MLSINAVKGFEYGSGFCGARMKGRNTMTYLMKTANKTNLSEVFKVVLVMVWDIYFRVKLKKATIMQKTTR
jgi:chorismate synthase